MVEVVVTHNIETLLEFLDRLGYNIEGVAPMVLEAVGNMVLESAKQTCPSPTSLMYQTASTGFLRDSHIMEHVSDKAVMVKPTAYYATFVHLGTMRAVARPWLEQAVQMVHAQAQERVRDLISSAVDQAKS